MDEGNRFHPNANYFYAPVAERLRLIFPKEWDLSEAERLSGLKHRGCVAYEADDVDRQYGVTWLLDRVADVTGVRDDLMKAFGFDIPDGCAPAYKSRKKSLKPRRGRPAKPKVEHQEL